MSILAANEYLISITGAIEIMRKQFQVSPKSIVMAEYKEGIDPEDTETSQWWEFTVVNQKDSLDTYRLSLQTEEAYLVGQSDSLEDDDEYQPE